MKEQKNIVLAAIKKAQKLNNKNPPSKIFLNKELTKKFKYFLPFEQVQEAKEKLLHYKIIFDYLFKETFLKENEDNLTPLTEWYKNFEEKYFNNLFSEKKISAYLLLSKKLAQTQKNKKNASIYEENRAILEYFFEEDEKDILYVSINTWLNILEKNPQYRYQLQIGSEKIKNKINQINQENKTNLLTYYSYQLVDYCIKTLNSCYLSLKFALMQLK